MASMFTLQTEQQVLKVSLVAVLAFSAIGITFGLISGSAAIIFDGVFSLVDAVMSVVSIVVAGLIARSTNQAPPTRLERRFTMGFWHFEPMVLALNGVVMISVATYALIQAVEALLGGGRDVEFGPAVAYAAIILVLTVTVGTIEYRANKRLGSALVAMDVKGWLMAGGVTSALLIAFVIGMIIDGTRWEWMMPYVDPAVLVVVAAVLLPVPFGILRKALSQMAMVTPAEVLADVDTVAVDTVAAEGFLDYQASVAQVGRAMWVDLGFRVPEGQTPRAVEEWDALRRSVEERLISNRRDDWVTIFFTTRPLPGKKLSQTR